MRASRLLTPALVAVTALALGAGCTNAGKLKRQADDLRLEVERLRGAGAPEWAPREYAMAETHLDFFFEEYEEWDWWEAQETLAVVRENVAKASEVTMHEADGDGDGVVDIDDRCPADAENFNGYLDDDGCPDGGYGVEMGRSFEVRESVEFEKGSTTIAAGSQSRLGSLVEQLAMDSSLRATIEGHTDDVGPAASNKSLSQRRADAVKRYLVGQGVSAARVTAIGYGEERPVSTNATPEGRSLNRRVEVILR